MKCGLLAKKGGRNMKFTKEKAKARCAELEEEIANIDSDAKMKKEEIDLEAKNKKIELKKELKALDSYLVIMGFREKKVRSVKKG